MGLILYIYNKSMHSKSVRSKGLRIIKGENNTTRKNKKT